MDNGSQRINVHGLGYIGLPTAVLLAKSGAEVLGVDVSAKRVEDVNNAIAPFAEPDLGKMLELVVKAGSLRASITPESADVFLIAVPTPVTKEHDSDLTFVRSACEAIASVLRPGNLVILESTVPPRTMGEVVCPVLEEGSGLRRSEDFLAAHCPERIMPGQAMYELVNNARVVGGIDRKSSDAGRKVYERFVEGPIWATDATTAETVKLMENSFRDVNIALANEFALICEHLGVDAWEAITLANKHPRVEILQPGPGVGGHCIPVDPYFLINAAKEQARVLSVARDVNEKRPYYIADFVLKALPDVPDRAVSVFGLSYRANIDDVRETPARPIIKRLLAAGVDVRCHDPHVIEFDPPVLGKKAALESSDCLLLLTNHKEFELLSPVDCAESMRTPLLIDTRHCLDGQAFRRRGFEVLVPGVTPLSKQNS